MPVGLVVVLGRRGLAEAGPDAGNPARRSVEQLATAADSGRREQLAQVGLEASPPGRSGRPRDRRPRTPRDGGADRLDRDLRPVLGMDPEPAARWTAAPGAATSKAAWTSSQTTASMLPGAVTDDEPQPLAAVSPLAKLALANRETPSDDCPSARSRTQARSAPPAGPRHWRSPWRAPADRSMKPVRSSLAHSKEGARTGRISPS